MGVDSFSTYLDGWGNDPGELELGKGWGKSTF